MFIMVMLRRYVRSEVRALVNSSYLYEAGVHDEITEITPQSWRQHDQLPPVTNLPSFQNVLKMWKFITNTFINIEQKFIMFEFGLSNVLVNKINKLLGY
jgi:hypothetical protein